MERKILMTKEDGYVWTWLMEERQITEIHCTYQTDSEVPKMTLGDIYIGKVYNIVANIGAAFIDIGGVYCYYDLSQAAHAMFTKKVGKKELCVGDELIVQISREAVKTKAPTVSSNISLTGRFVVLTSGNTKIGISSKIPKAQREEWKTWMEMFRNEEYGLILRTNAKDAAFDRIREEIELLQKRFFKLKQTAGSRTCFSCLEAAPRAYITDLKNVYTEGLTEIVVEDESLYEEVSAFFAREQTDLLDLLRKYNDPQISLSACYSTYSVLQKALNERVWLKSGAYLVIQPTEGLTVIDVNSGKCVSKKADDSAYLKMNLEAAREIARQLRLRNLSGIIIVDFINMDSEESMQKLLKNFRSFLARDPVPTTLVDVTQLQLVELTRKKIRKPLYETFKNKDLHLQIQTL